MSASTRSFLVPGVAFAAAGVMALGPAVAAPPSLALAHPAVPVPAVAVQDIALAGIGRDIYDSITNFVQYTVESAQFWIDLIPVIGPPLADQLGINYFQGIQPLVAATVYYISDLIAEPFNFLGLTVAYGSNLFYTGYNWVSAQSQFFGLPPLAPIPAPPPLASVAAPSAPAGRGAVPAAAATGEVTVDVAPVDPVATEAPDAPKAAASRAGRDGQRGASTTPRAAASVAKAVTDEPAAGAAPSRASAGKAGASRGTDGGR